MATADWTGGHSAQEYVNNMRMILSLSVPLAILVISASTEINSTCFKVPVILATPFCTSLLTEDWEYEPVPALVAVLFNCLLQKPPAFGESDNLLKNKKYLVVGSSLLTSIQGFQSTFRHRLIKPCSLL